MLALSGVFKFSAKSITHYPAAFFVAVAFTRKSTATKTVPLPLIRRKRTCANIILKCHSEQKMYMWENRKRARRICDGVAFPILL